MYPQLLQAIIQLLQLPVQPADHWRHVERLILAVADELCERDQGRRARHLEPVQLCNGLADEVVRNLQA